MCGAGRRFVQITPRGDIQLCPDTPLGNLLDGSFARLAGDALCSATNWHYGCLRHADMPEPEQAVLARRGLIRKIQSLDEALKANALSRDEAVQQIQQQIKALRRLIPVVPATGDIANGADS